MKRFLIFFLIILIQFSLVLAVQPFGANVNEINSTRAAADSPSSAPALAGNVTELNIDGYSVTQSWQGYFGNVSGTIQLSDSEDNIMYNWSLASPQGEIYASINDSLEWTYIQCLNFSADGTYGNDQAQVGGTSFYGTNLTQLESTFNIIPDDVDGVNETFTLQGVGTHNQFFTNNLEFSEGECMSTRVFDSTGSGQDNNFEEVLLYEPESQSVVFTSLLNEDTLGFDGRTHDFEMLVLEDGHGTDTDTTTYYFYVELE